MVVSFAEWSDRSRLCSSDSGDATPECARLGMHHHGVAQGGTARLTAKGRGHPRAHRRGGLRAGLRPRRHPHRRRGRPARGRRQRVAALPLLRRQADLDAGRHRPPDRGGARRPAARARRPRHLRGPRQWRDRLVTLQRSRHCAGGCPIGSIAAEIADDDPEARADLVAGFEQWEAPIRAGLARMRDRGVLRDDTDTDRLALALLAALQGGLLLTQTRRTTLPFAPARRHARPHRDVPDAAVGAPRLPSPPRPWATVNPWHPRALFSTTGAAPSSSPAAPSSGAAARRTPFPVVRHRSSASTSASTTARNGSTTGWTGPTSASPVTHSPQPGRSRISTGALVPVSASRPPAARARDAPARSSPAWRSSTALPAEHAVGWVRHHFHHRAVQTPWQRRWVRRFPDLLG